MIIIINGPLGIGKTETAWELLYHFEKAVMLDGDYLGAVVPYDIYDPQRIEYLYQTLQHIIDFHRARGFQNFVINYVFEESESLERLCELLREMDDEIHAFRLTCAEEEIARRIQKRSQDPERVSWELQRFRQLTAIQEAAAQRGELGRVVDTTRLTARQAAEAIWEQVFARPHP